MARRRLATERERQRLMHSRCPGSPLCSPGPSIATNIQRRLPETAGDRDFIGRTVREVFPHIAGQRFYELLDKVYATGEPFAARAMPISLDRPQPRFRNPLDSIGPADALALPKVGFKLLKDFAALGVNEAKTDRLWRPLGFPSSANRRSRIPRRNLDVVKRSKPPKVANTKSLGLARHSECATL
jgi:hypothetical protein